MNVSGRAPVKAHTVDDEGGRGGWRGWGGGGG